MRPKLLFDKDEWFLGEHIPDCDIFFFQLPATSFCNDTSYPFIKKYKKFLGVFNKFALDFYVGKKDSFDVAESILKALIDRPNFGKELDSNIIHWSDELIKLAKKISSLPLASYSNEKLFKLYQEHDKIHTKLYTFGWLPVSVDLFHNNFTNYLKRYLYSVCESKAEAEDAFVIFTTPSQKTILALERQAFIGIYEKYKTLLKLKKTPDGLVNALEKHSKQWGHLGYIYAGNVEPFGLKHYLQELKELADMGISAKIMLAQESKRLVLVKKKQQELYRKLKILKLYKRLFESAKNFALSKLVRRHAQLLDMYLLHKTLVKEISKRLNLNRYQVQFMFMDEVGEALIQNKYDSKIIKNRLKHCVYYVERGFEKVYSGSIEQRLRALVRVKYSKNINQLSGQTAQPGFARGIVKIIFRAKDMRKMNKGDILVSVATDPDVVPAMKKAAAIITEQGGITSHAAIVSRELSIPCIIGTRIATKVFKDGDRVEVDATKGIVRKI